MKLGIMIAVVLVTSILFPPLGFFLVGAFSCLIWQRKRAEDRALERFNEWVNRA